MEWDHPMDVPAMTTLVPDKLDQLIQEAMEEWQIPGLSLAVVRDGEPDHLKAFGLRDVEAGLPTTTDTQFILCSITKSFTALGLAMLVDDGRLDWTKPVRDYLPDFRLHDPIATDRVTVLDLLCHRSGLPRHDWIWMPGDISRQEMFAALRHIEPSQDIRSDFQYCNLGYVVAGMVAERICGQSWEDFTHDRIMKPLGMIHTGFSHQDLKRSPDSARPYVLEDLEKPGSYVRRCGRSKTLPPAASTPPPRTWRDTCGSISPTAASTEPGWFRRRAYANCKPRASTPASPNSRRSARPTMVWAWRHTIIAASVS
jgi:CubicO group peptidase (beta-lactamase class C family)